MVLTTLPKLYHWKSGKIYKFDFFSIFLSPKFSSRLEESILKTVLKIFAQSSKRLIIPKFFKTFFLLKRSSGHVERSFNNPTEKFLVKVRENLWTTFFKKFQHKMFVWTRKNQLCESSQKLLHPMSGTNLIKLSKDFRKFSRAENVRLDTNTSFLGTPAKQLIFFRSKPDLNSKTSDCFQKNIAQTVPLEISFENNNFRTKLYLLS